MFKHLFYSLLAPSVAHTFSSSRSFYNITVVAFNENSRKGDKLNVCVQERLQGQYSQVT